jgi:hypothetical protein
MITLDSSFPAMFIWILVCQQGRLLPHFMSDVV